MTRDQHWIAECLKNAFDRHHDAVLPKPGNGDGIISFPSILAERLWRNIQLGSKTDRIRLPHLDEILIEIFGGKKVELVADRRAFPLKPLVNSLEMLRGVFELFLVLDGRVADLAVVFHLDDEDSIADLNEKIGTELAALWVFALFPGVFDRVEILLRVLDPCVQYTGVLTLAKATDKSTLRVMIGYRQVERCLEIVVVFDRLAAPRKVPIGIHNLGEELDLFLGQSRLGTWAVENRLVASANSAALQLSA